MARTARSRIPLVVDALEQARARGQLHEYVVLEESCERAAHQQGVSAIRRNVDADRLQATLYRDLRQGRGSASFTMAQGDEGEVDGLVAAAASRAGSGVGLAWQMPRPAAPARAVIAEPLRDGVEGAVRATVAAVTAAVPEPLRLSRLEVTVESSHTAVQTSTGFANAYPATMTRVNATLAGRDDTPGRVETVRCQARRVADLDLSARIAAAAIRLEARARTTRLDPGVYDLLLRHDALLGEPARLEAVEPGYGWFGPIVAQASATLARQGLTRYQLGQSIFGERRPTGDPLTITSDGTIDYQLLSRPFGELGEPVRRFEVVREGVATGLALDLREAALRGATPNGGLRNLAIARGPTPLSELSRPTGRPLIEVIELTWLETNPRTGGFVAELGLGYRHDRGAPATIPIDGGAINGNVFDLFADARLTLDATANGWYSGPAGIRLDGITVR